MAEISFKPKRAYPSLPTIGADLESHSRALEAIKECLEIHERKTGNVQDSFVRVEELESLGLVTLADDVVVDGSVDSDGSSTHHHDNTYLRLDGGNSMFTGTGISWVDSAGSSINFLEHQNAPGAVTVEHVHSIIDTSPTPVEVTDDTQYTTIHTVISAGTLTAGDQYLLVAEAMYGAASGANHAEPTDNDIRWAYGATVLAADATTDRQISANGDQGEQIGFAKIITATAGDALILEGKTDASPNNSIKSSHARALAINLTDLTSANYIAESTVASSVNVAGTEDAYASVGTYNIGDGTSDYILFCNFKAVMTDASAGNVPDFEAWLRVNGGPFSNSEIIKCGGSERTHDGESFSRVFALAVPAAAAATLDFQCAWHSDAGFVITTDGTVSVTLSIIALRLNDFTDYFITSSADLSDPTGAGETERLNTTRSSTAANGNWCFFGGLSSYYPGSGFGPEAEIRLSLNAGGDVAVAGDINTTADNTSGDQAAWIPAFPLAATNVNNGDSMEIGLFLDPAPNVAGETWQAGFIAGWSHAATPTVEKFVVGDPLYPTEIDGASVKINTTLNVTGATDLDSTLNVDGAATLQSTLNVVGAVDLDSTLNVDGIADFNANVDVNTGGKVTIYDPTDTYNLRMYSDTATKDAVFDSETGGDSTAGFRWTRDNGALELFNMDSTNGFYSTASSAMLAYGTSSTSSPGLSFKADQNTGVHGSGDNLYLVAGGRWSLNIRELSSQTQWIVDYVNKTASATQTQGQAQTSSTWNCVSGVVNDNDVITLQNPTSGLGHLAFVTNASITGNTLQVYPDTGDEIAGEGVNAPVFIKQYRSDLFIAQHSGLWHRFRPMMSAADIDLVNLVGTPDYETVLDYLNVAGQVGTSTGGVVTDNGDGTVAVTEWHGWLRSGAATSDLYSAKIAANSSLAVTDGVVSYIYAEYNAGTPQFTAYTAWQTDRYGKVWIASVHRNGTTIHVTTSPSLVPNFTNLWTDREATVYGIVRETGGITSESGTRNIAITAGEWWLGVNEFSTTAKDTSVADTFSYYYRDGVGGYTEVTAQTQINNTQYDDGSGTLATLTNNRYGVHWVYTAMDDDVYVVYGRGDYTLVQAEAATPPSDVPDHVVPVHGLLIAKIIIRKSASTFTSVQNPFSQVFTMSGAIDHGELAGLTDDDHTQYLLADGSRVANPKLVVTDGTTWTTDGLHLDETNQAGFMGDDFGIKIFAGGGRYIGYWDDTGLAGKFASPTFYIVGDSAPSATTPIYTYSTDNDTGQGRAANDALSMIAGGVEAMRWTEASNRVLYEPDGQFGLTAFATGGQASATQIVSSYNMFTTVATAGDSCKLPATFTVGTMVHIRNAGAAAMDIFPASGDDLGGGANVAYRLPPGGYVVFVGTVADSTWVQYRPDGIAIGADGLTIYNSTGLKSAAFAYSGNNYVATFTGTDDWNVTGARLVTAASTTTKAGLNIPEGTAPSSPVDGDIWVTTTDILARINGVSESLLGGGSSGPMLLYKQSDEGRTSTTTLAADSDLVASSLTADTMYIFEVFVIVTGSAIGDFKYDFNCTQTQQDWMYTVKMVSTSGSPPSYGSDIVHDIELDPSTDTSGVIGDLDGTETKVFHFTGFVHTNATTGGNLEFRWSQENASGTTTVLSGSWMRVTELGTA